MVVAASPFLAKPIQMSFAGLGFLLISPPARAQHCTQAGGYMKREPKQLPAEGMSGSPWAPLRGSLRWQLLVPFHTSPLSRGALRSAGVPTIAASTTSAPWPPGESARGARHLGRLRSGARENPMCAEGWAMWVLGGSPDLFKATGGTYRLGKPLG
jgi:hypothetical protein